MPQSEAAMRKKYLVKTTTTFNQSVLFLATIIATTAFADDAFDPGGLRLMQVKPLDERVRPPDDVAVAVWPSGIIDAGGTHYLNQHNLTVIIVAVANPQATNIISSRVVCDLPRGVDLKAVNANLL